MGQLSQLSSRGFLEAEGVELPWVFEDSGLWVDGMGRAVNEKGCLGQTFGLSLPMATFPLTC